MTRGIREFAVASFAQHLPRLGEVGNTAFRKAVMGDIIQQFNTSVASAATHYNHALKLQRASAPATVAGLGRPEDKKGGRKPIHTVTVVKAKTGEVVAENISRAKGEALIAAAAASKKAKLMFLEPVADAKTEAAPAAEAGSEAPAEAAPEASATAAETAPAAE